MMNSLGTRPQLVNSKSHHLQSLTPVNSNFWDERSRLARICSGFHIPRVSRPFLLLKHVFHLHFFFSFLFLFLSHSWSYFSLLFLTCSFISPFKNIGSLVMRPNSSSLSIALQTNGTSLFSKFHYTACLWIPSGTLFCSSALPHTSLCAIATSEGPIIIATQSIHNLKPVSLLYAHSSCVTRLALSTDSAFLFSVDVTIAWSVFSKAGIKIRIWKVSKTVIQWLPPIAKAEVHACLDCGVRNRCRTSGSVSTLRIFSRLSCSWIDQQTMNNWFETENGAREYAWKHRITCSGETSSSRWHR
jgi:hypothetical protein